MSRDPLPPPPPPPPPPPSAAAATVCGNCCSDDRWILHNVRIKGLYRKLCTSCILKLHPSSFCPTCFSLHDHIAMANNSSSSNNGNNRTLKCFKCSSLSHAMCVPPNAPKSPYLCPPCSNPSFKFFDLCKQTSSRKPQNQSGNNMDDDSNSVPEGEERKEQFIDERSAKVLLAAAKIAANSMSKAAYVVRAESERRVKEAALARKRAKEAIDLVMSISARAINNHKRRETATATTTEVSAMAVAAPPLSGGLKGPNVVPVRLEKNGGGEVAVVVGRANAVAVAALPPSENNGAEAMPVPVVVPSGSQHVQENNGSSHVGNGGKDSTGPECK